MAAEYKYTLAFMSYGPEVRPRRAATGSPFVNHRGAIGRLPATLLCQQRRFTTARLVSGRAQCEPVACRV